MDQAKKKKSTYLSSLSTEEGIRKVLKGKEFCAADMSFPFVALFVDRGPGFGAQQELTTVSVQYTDAMDKKPVDQKDVHLPPWKPSTLQSKLRR